MKFYVLNSTQFFYIIITAYFGYKFGMLLVDEVIGMAFGFLGIILGCIIFFWALPDIMDAYALGISVEMMRNRECIDIVIKH